MSNKELKSLIELGTSLGYKDAELRQFVADERARIDQKTKEEAETQRIEKEKEKEREREFELEKIRLENAKLERENEQKIEAQKLEAAEKEKQREFQLRMKQLEVDAAVQQSTSDMSMATNNSNNGSLAIKSLKLPLFDDDKDDLDAYLSRFERTCKAFSIQPEHWSTQLARLLQGQALDVYQRMSDDDVDDYQLLKSNLLKRFRLTEGGYRRRFKRSKIESGETPSQFIDRLRRYLTKWREMAGFDATFEGLEEMILRDQFFLTCDEPLKIFLKEKGKLNLKDMSKTAANYIEAHEKPDTGRERQKTGQGKRDDKQTTMTSCVYCGLRNHRSEDCRRKAAESKETKTVDITCFHCGKVGHRRNQCPQLRGTQQTAAMQVIPEQKHSDEIAEEADIKGDQKCTKHNDQYGELELACGCKIPVIASAVNSDARQWLHHLCDKGMPCCVGKVNGIEVTVLRDTGSTACVLKTALVKPQQFTGSYQLCKLIDGVVKRFPTAIVDIDTPFYRGQTTVMCMEDPVQELIIGNVPGAIGLESIKTDMPSGNTSIPTDDCKQTQKLADSVDNSETEKVQTTETSANAQLINLVKEDDLHAGADKLDSDGAVSETSQDYKTAAAVQTRAMVKKEERNQKPLKVKSLKDLDMGPERFAHLQREDPTLKKYWEFVDKDEIPGKPTFFVKKGILYRKYTAKDDHHSKVQLVVPTELRGKVVSLAHDTLLSGHRGPSKTLNRVQQEFYWPGVHEFVGRYTASCDLCQRNVSKGTVGKAPMQKLPLVSTPFSAVCIDLVGPLHPPSDGHRYILTMIDMCTRFPEAVPLKNIDSSTVAEALVNIFSRVGIPQRVHSDRGSQFTSDMMREVYRLLGIRQTTTSPYHAMGNGIIENFNKTIKNLLKKVASEKPTDWHRYLGPLMFAVRDTPQDSTGFSPFELIYGHNVRTPMSLLKRLWTAEETDTETRTAYQYVIDLRDRIEETCEMAKQELSKVQLRNRQYYNRHARTRRLDSGDSVLLLLPTERNKLTLAWRGPFKVIAKVGEVNYRIDMGDGKLKTYHVNMLKKYFQRSGSEPKPKSTEVCASKSTEVNTEQLAAVACVIDEETDVEEGNLTVNDVDKLHLYNTSQKETIDDIKINPELSVSQQQEAKQLLLEFKDIFSDVPTVTNLIEHKVQLTQTEPIKSKPYPTPYKMREIVDKEIEAMLSMGVIEHSEAAYASPLVLVKKPDGSYRVCVNFKELNKITVFDPEPMMSPDDIFPKLAGSQYYSSFDFSKGYWAIPMEESSKDFTTFVCSRGLMRFKVMPFGMVNSGSTYNRMIRKLLDGCENLESYVDDILSHSRDWQSHMITLRDFFQRVKKSNLKLRPSKCQIGFQSVDFLGHRLQGDSITPQAESIGRILDTARPTTKRQCRSLIGMVNFYRRYIPNCAEIIAPITDLTKSQAATEVKWGSEQEKAFKAIKHALSSEPVLKLPDLQKDFIVNTDASNTAIGACLMQEHDGVKHPILYASRKLLPREQNYTVGEREALAIVWGIDRFQRYLYGQHFTLESDHRPLEYLQTSHSKSPRLMRWSLALQPYHFTVKYIRGCDNAVADYLSRC